MKEKPKKSVRMWVAREKMERYFCSVKKPKKSKSYWINSNTFNSLVLPKWEDNEPTRVIIRLA